MRPLAPPIAAFVALLALAHCGSDGAFDDSGAPGVDATRPAPDASALDVSPGADAAHPSQCPGGTPARISGTVLAPNGRDPIPGVYAYVVPDAQTLPPPATGVTCTVCANPPTALAFVQSSADGTFALMGGALDAGGTFTVVVESGGFRHVERHVALGACASVALRPAQTTLPGRSNGEDTIPRIVVAGFRGAGSRTADVNDRFTLVLDALGITGYDVVDPDRSGANSGAGPDLIGLLSSPSQLNRYQMLFVPCGALGNFDVAAHVTPAMATNLRTWLAAGGRLYVSDLAYSVIDRSAPGAITFANGTPPRGDPADIGVGLATGATLPGTVDDAPLRAWLQQVGVIPAGATTLPLADFKDPWGAIDQVPDSELTGRTGTSPAGVVLVSGDVQWHQGPTGPHHHPLTVQVDVPGASGGYCGRVVFTSYHVQSSASTTMLSPQERVLEYLFFRLSSCVDTPG